ncbi:MAG TPA: ATP-binding protein [Stellaceae bacterium]|nr:ATP-binding protein [Stellaceae bacterium]
MEPMLLQQFIGLLQNAALLALGVLAYAWLREGFERWSPPARAWAEGMVGFGLAVLCMSAPVRLESGVQVDSRDAIIALVTVFGGPVAGAAAAVAAATYRLWLGGVGAPGGAIGIAASFGVSLPFWHWLHRRKAHPDHRHILALALAVGAALLVDFFVEPHAVATEMWRRAGIAGFTIVPGAVFLLGAIMVRFERGRAAERRVAESEARLHSIIDNLPQPLSISDRQNRFLLVNRAYERRTGLSAAELIGQEGKKLAELVEGFEAVREMQRRVWRTGEAGRTPPMPVSHRGQPFSFVFSSFPIRNATGGFDAIGTVCTDVTKLVAAREDLMAREARLQRQHQALVEILRGNAVAEGPMIETVRKLTEIAAGVTGADGACVHLIEHERRLARCLDAFRRDGRHGGLPEVELELESHLALIADLRRQRVVAIDDTLGDPRLAALAEILQTRGVHSMLVAGVYLGSRLEGFFTFFGLEARRAWSADDVAFARSVADLLALMLLTSRHREALAALDLVSDAIYVEREDGTVIYANRPARALAGLPPAADGAPFAAAVFPRPREPLRGKRDVQEIDWTVSGQKRELSARRSKLPGEGVVTVIEDITSQRAEQRNRERLQAQLQQASKMEAIGQLAGGIAHDFNNLLGAVIGFARFLEQDLPAQTQQHQFVQRILSAGNRGKELVAQILAFTRARAVEKKPIDLRAALRDSLDLLAGSLPATTQLAADAGELPLMVEANETQLGQIIVNLCLNAHDAMAGRPGRIGVSLSRIRPGDADYRRTLLVGLLDPARAYARLDVADGGGGIPAENLPRIFEPFFTTKERGRGTGLGLAVVHGVVTTYEGACAVESNPDRGTRFSIYLPLAEARKGKTSGEQRGADLRGRERVLVIDDEVDITDMLSIGLERLGYEVAALNDPAEALNAVKAAPAAWDAIVTDHLMPGMQGLSLAQELKTLRSDLIVILCTGLDDGVVGQAAKARGVDAFFAKPVEPAHIAAAIRDLVRH